MAKRLFDLCAALVGLVLMSPLFLLVAILIRLDSPGPVFYRGDRVGKGGAPFKIYKFRTMVVNASQMGAGFTVSGDPRITRMGRFLRKWKIDEVPQLINVLQGEMSLVGPRPEAPGYVQYYTSQQRQVLRVKPGITGLTQVRFRHEESLLSRCGDPEKNYMEKIVPQKLGIDLQYIETRSLLVDLKLILQTFLCLLEADDLTESDLVETVDPLPEILSPEDAGTAGL